MHVGFCEILLFVLTSSALHSTSPAGHFVLSFVQSIAAQAIVNGCVMLPLYGLEFHGQDFRLIFLPVKLSANLL